MADRSGSSSWQPDGLPAGSALRLNTRDIAGDAFLAQPLGGVREQPFEDPLARLVMDDQVKHAAALRRRVFRVADRVQVQAAPVPEQHAAALAPGHDRAEQAAPRLLRRQLPLPAAEKTTL